MSLIEKTRQPFFVDIKSDVEPHTICMYSVPGN